MGAKKNVDMSSNKDTVKIVKAEVEAPATEEKTAVSSSKRTRQRSKKYQQKRSLVDKTKAYNLESAVELVKKTSYSKFVGTISAHLVFKEVGEQAKLSLPYSSGKTIKIAIADEAVIEKIADGKIDFDVLLTTPEFVPKLAKYARVLGPKGLMPNPKNGTITNNPDKRAQELAKGEVTIKTDRKQPITQVSVGKVSQPTKEIVSNLEEIIKRTKGKLVKLNLSATMGPSVRVNIDAAS